MTTTAYQSPASLGARDIVGVALQNAGSGTLEAGIATFGQVFAAGDLPAGKNLSATINGKTVEVQLDVKSTYPDGSVKMAVVSVERPELGAGQQAEVILGIGSSGKANGRDIDLEAALDGHSFLVDMKLAGGGTVHVDVLDALRDALANGTASVWQDGSLASQARVEIQLAGSQRMVFDVTAFKDGGFSVEAQFNNDDAMGATGGRVKYDLTVTMDGQKVAQESVNQGQYQNWHRSFSANDHDGGQGLGSADAGWLNIRHDVGYLGESGAIAQYDTSLKVSDSLISGWTAAQQAAGWGDPLASNGLTQYMPTTGGRSDIGVTTAGNTGWLLSGDAYAAAYAMGQAEAAGGIPWNFWDAANGTWLNSDNYAKLWTDARASTGKPGDANAGGLTQGVPTDTGWTPDLAHQPDASYVPYLLTGERWILDNLQAQAVYNVMSVWPGARTADGALIAEMGQARSIAWGLREIQNAAFASADGSTEKAYLQGVEDANWSWLVKQIPGWTAMQGEAYGWVPNINGNAELKPWQQDYLASTAIAAASRGNADALTFLKWQSNFLVGRFLAADDGFALRDGAAYVLASGDGTNAFKTWAEIGAATLAKGWSNGTSSWDQTQGDYARLALMTLAGIYQLTGSAEAYAAYRALLGENPPFVSSSAFSSNPTTSITIPALYAAWADLGGIIDLPGNSGSIPGPSKPQPAPPGTTPPVTSPAPGAPNGTGGTAGADNLVLQSAVNGSRIDLQGGNDTLTLATGANNTVTVVNVETVIGGSGTDRVTLAVDSGFKGTNAVNISNVEVITGSAVADQVTLKSTLFGGSIDLAAGADTLILANGDNKISVANVETIRGGTGDDKIILTTALSGGSIDLGGGNDSLNLSSSGANSITVGNVEVLTGGDAADTITLSSTVLYARIDLGGGADSLTLSSGGANAVTVSNVETITGGSAADTVTLATAMASGRIDLGGGKDSLLLASTGANTFTVLNVESITGGNADDRLTLGTALLDGRIDLGGGNDKLTLSSAGANRLTLLNVETILGGSAADTITLGTALQGGTVSLGAGIDSLTLSAFGANRITVADVETILAGNAADTITLSTALLGGSINLGGGTDSLTLSSDSANRVTVTDVETIKGGAAADAITLGNAMLGGSIDLGAGSDSLVLSSNGANRLVVTGVESITGGNAADAITLGGAQASGAIHLGGGLDSLTLSSAGTNTLTVSGIETITGGGAADRITFSAALVGGSIDLGGGADTLTLSSAGANRFNVTNVETVIGGAASDTVTALGNGAVRLEGNGGNDVLAGAGGADTLVGGAGADLLTGGGGADRFVYTAIGDSSTGAADRITDFNTVQDRLVFENMLVGKFDFVGKDGFSSDGHSEARFVEASRQMQIDVNGDGRIDMAITLDGVSLAQLSKADFFWS